MTYPRQSPAVMQLMVEIVLSEAIVSHNMSDSPINFYPSGCSPGLRLSAGPLLCARQILGFYLGLDSVPKPKVEAFTHSERQISLSGFFNMFTARKKIHKDKDAEPSEFEESVAQAFFDLENPNQELKSDLKDLYINSAALVDVAGNRKAVVIHVPFRLRKAFRKIHVRLVRELEKKFSGKDVILIATRRIVRPPKKGSAAQRPRTRTLTAVHEAVLEDVVLPAEIVGKRIRYRLDGSKIMKVFLDPKERNNTEYKLESFSAVYRKLSGKDVVFEYPITEA
ncbi:hypothetical protein ACLB2K_049379 [Fragaria x ananassa]